MVGCWNVFNLEDHFQGELMQNPPILELAHEKVEPIFVYETVL